MFLRRVFSVDSGILFKHLHQIPFSNYTPAPNYDSYKNLEILESSPQNFEISLHGKKLKTPSKKPLKVPTFRLASEIVKELQRAKDKASDIDIRNTPLFDMATNANESKNDIDLRGFYLDFLKDYFRKDRL